MRLLASLTLVLACGVAPACAPAAGDAAAPDTDSEDALRRQSQPVCKTVDYHHTRSNHDYFMPFETDEAALTYARDMLPRNGKSAPRGISTDATINRLVAEAYEGFVRVYPNETRGMANPPRVVIVDDNEVQAFAAYDDDPSVDKAPWLFFVHAGMLSGAVPEAELRGVFAHELAHLILRNVLPETRKVIRRHYRVQGPETGVIGAVQPEDVNVARRIELVQKLGEAAGRFTELGPMPRGFFTYSQYELAIAGLQATDRPASPSPAECTRADDLEQKISALAVERISMADMQFHLDEAQRSELAALTRGYVEATTACYAHVERSLFEAKVRGRALAPTSVLTDADVRKQLDENTPEHAQALKDLMSQDELALDADTSKTLIEKIFAGSAAAHARLDELARDRAMPIDTLRVFDHEEDADDAAVRVLSAIGQDPMGQATFLYRMMADAAVCKTMIAEGKVPAYGRFIDDHPAPCYRVYHAKQLTTRLATCPK